MRAIKIGIVVVGLALPFAAATTVNADNIGQEGCTPGYWKNHPESWLEDTGIPFPTTKTLASTGIVTASTPNDASLLTALNYGGGGGLQGAEQILLRAAAAAFLNAATEELGYPLRRGGPDGIIAMVNAAIASGNRQTMIGLAGSLDSLNNLGCPL